MNKLKVLKIIFFVVIIAVALLFLAQFINNRVVAGLNKDTFERYVQEKILEKDSENRGFSDIVKKNIDDSFKGEDRSVFYKYAKYTRLALLAKNEEEFLAYKYKLNQLRSCQIYIINKYNYKYDFEKFKTFYTDNDEMIEIINNAAELHFSNVDLMDKIQYNFNEKTKTVFNENAYEQNCK